MDNLVDSLEIFLSFRALVYDLSLLDEWCGSLGKDHDLLGSMLAAFILIWFDAHCVGLGSKSTRHTN